MYVHRRKERSSDEKDTSEASEERKKEGHETLEKTASMKEKTENDDASEGTEAFFLMITDAEHRKSRMKNCMISFQAVHSIVM